MDTALIEVRLNAKAERPDREMEWDILIMMAYWR